MRVVREGTRSGAVPMLVKLQRPPPEITILAARLRGVIKQQACGFPRRPAVSAHIRPAAPAPMMTASIFGFDRHGCDSRVGFRGSHLDL